MSTVLLYWFISALVLIVFSILLGNVVGKGWLGVLVDNRGRMSLSQFQLVLWTIALLSLLAGVFVARLLAGIPSPQNIVIPNELLAVMGISAGSSVGALAIKSSKDARANANVNVTATAGVNPAPTLKIRTAQMTGKQPNFWELFLTEEGSIETIDFTRFQNFWLTIIVFISYLAMTIVYLNSVSVAGMNTVATLPTFDSSQVSFLAISHAGYLAGKLPDRA